MELDSDKPPADKLPYEAELDEFTTEFARGGLALLND